MFKNSFGTHGQLTFNDEHEFYRFLGYLARSNGETSLVLEHNEQQGAWGSEGRIQIHTSDFSTKWPVFSTTAGNGGNVLSRINCNEFIKEIVANHAFVESGKQNIASILATIPPAYVDDFNDGLAM